MISIITITIFVAKKHNDKKKWISIKINKYGLSIKKTNIFLIIKDKKKEVTSYSSHFVFIIKIFYLYYFCN